MRCKVDGCDEESKYSLCLAHWKENKEGALTKCGECDALLDSGKPLCLTCYRTSKGSSSGGGKGARLSATQIGELIGLKAYGVNRVLAELGWIEKDLEGWIATDLGKKQGAFEKHHAQSGVPYVVWPEAIVSNRFFDQVVAEFATGPEATAILQTIDVPDASPWRLRRWPPLSRTWRRTWLPQPRWLVPTPSRWHRSSRGKSFQLCTTRSMATSLGLEQKWRSTIGST